MKKYFALCIVFLVIFIVSETKAGAWWWSKDDTPYITSEDTKERTAENIIRDIWESKVSWKTLDKSLSDERVISIQSIPQVDGTLALDMRIRLDRSSTESQVIFLMLGKLKKFMPKLLADNNLSSYNEFRLFGSLPMSDKNGKISGDNILKIFFTRSAAEKIQWDKFDDYNLHHLLIKLNSEKECTYWINGNILSKAKWLK